MRWDTSEPTGWGLTRNEAALLGAIIGYGILVVFVTPLLLGFLPLLAIGWMLRVPVASIQPTARRWRSRCPSP